MSIVVSLNGLPCRCSSCQSFELSDCFKSTSVAISDIRLFLRSRVVSFFKAVRGATFDILLFPSDSLVRFTAYCSPVRSKMPAWLVVSVVNVNISVAVSISPASFPTVLLISAWRLVSGIATGELGSVAVAVNSAVCDRSAAATRTVVVPMFPPSVRCAAALPPTSVVVVLVLSRPRPAVMVKVTGTPENTNPL